MTGQLSFGGLEFVIPIVLIALIVFVIVALVTARRDPDPQGHRPYAVYLVLVLFLALFTALFSATTVVQNLVRIPLQDETRISLSLGATNRVEVSAAGVGGTTVHPLPAGAVHPLFLPPTVDPDDEHVSAAVQAAFVLIAALLGLWFHVRRLRELVQDPSFTRSPGRRTYQVYLHTVSFVSMAVLLFAAAAAAYGVFRAIAPGTTGQFTTESYERGQGMAQAVTGGFLALASYAIFAYHWRRTRTLRGPSPLPAEQQAAPPSPPRHAASPLSPKPAAEPPKPPSPEPPKPPPAEPTKPPAEPPKPPPAEPPGPPSEPPPSGEAPPPVIPPT